MSLWSKCLILFTNVLLFFVLITQIQAEISKQQDSYIKALHNSHQTNSNVISRKDFSYSPDHSDNSYDYHQPDNQYGPPENYGAPLSSYAPSEHYGVPPSSSYGAPADSYSPSSYGPSKPVYGPPPIYGPPLHPMPIYVHEHPRDSWFWDKFKFKIDIYTIGKILLKLIIFKKIVKFIALICLLLVLPKLKNLMKDDDEEMEATESRKFTTEKEKLNERINEITNFALVAIETFSRKYDNCGRDQVWCRFQRMFDVIDAKYPYEKIVKLYLPESEEIVSNEVTK